MAQKEIKTKIGVVKKTQKITNTMQMVAASKIRKTQKQMETSQPYAIHIREVMEHIAHSHTEYRYPYWQGREKIQCVGYIVVATDRGLCGGLNINLFRKVLTVAQHWRQQGIAIDWCLFGSKARSFFRTIDANVVAHAEKLGDIPTLANLIGNVQVMFKAYQEGKLDRIFIAFNEFISKMKQVPKIMQLLPIAAHEIPQKTGWDYIYEPEPKKLLDQLLVRYLEMQVYQSVVHNIACEQAARMVAMKSATDNAAEILQELNLAYNKARQNAITKEISEIIGGAAALKQGTNL